MKPSGAVCNCRRGGRQDRTGEEGLKAGVEPDTSALRRDTDSAQPSGVCGVAHGPPLHLHLHLAGRVSESEIA